MHLKQTTGSRAQVMHGTAKKTTGGLTKSQLKYNKQGKIVSKKASALAKKNNRLVKAGYITRKGDFGVSMKGGGKEFNVSEFNPIKVKTNPATKYKPLENTTITYANLPTNIPNQTFHKKHRVGIGLMKYSFGTKKNKEKFMFLTDNKPKWTMANGSVEYAIHGCKHAVQYNPDSTKLIDVYRRNGTPIWSEDKPDEHNNKIAKRRAENNLRSSPPAWIAPTSSLPVSSYFYQRGK